MAKEAAADQQVELVIHQSGLVGVFISCFFFLKVNVLTKLLYLFSAASNRFVLKKQTKKQKVFHPSKSKIYFKGLQEWKISIIHACSYEVLHKNMKNWGMKYCSLVFLQKHKSTIDSLGSTNACWKKKMNQNFSGFYLKLKNFI